MRNPRSIWLFPKTVVVVVSKTVEDRPVRTPELRDKIQNRHCYDVQFYGYVMRRVLLEFRPMENDRRKIVVRAVLNEPES